MTWILVYNTSRSIVALDDVGSYVPPAEFAAADDTRSEVQRLLNNNVLEEKEIYFDPATDETIDYEARLAAATVIVRNGGGWSPPPPPDRPFSMSEIDQLLRNGRLSEASVVALIQAKVAEYSGGPGITNADQVLDGTVKKMFLATERAKLSGIAVNATANATDTFLRSRANHTGTQSTDTLTDGTTTRIFLATERSKLSAIAEGATVNSSDASLRARGSHTGTQSADTIVDGTTHKSYTNAESSKLAGIAVGATVNSTDAALRDRATHTGTQTAASISDLAAAVRTVVAAMAVAGANMDIAFNSTTGKLTFTSIGGSSGGGTDPEIVRDTINQSMQGVGLISVGPDDLGDVIVVSTTATQNSTDAFLRARSNHTGTQSADTISDGVTNRLFTAAEKTKLGNIATAATANSTDASLRDRTTHTGVQAVSTVNGLQAALDGKADLVAGKVPTTQLPASVDIDVWDVSSQAAMLALSATKGDVARRSDLQKTFQLATSSPGTLADWKEYYGGGGTGGGTGTVTSVNGVAPVSGNVTISKTDVGLSAVDNTSDANKPISVATTAALAAKAPIASPTFTGTVSGVTKAMVGLSLADNTSDATKPVSAAQQTALNGKVSTTSTNMRLDYGTALPASGTAGRFFILIPVIT